MKRSILLLAGVVALAAAGVAQAKGPREATVTGPGLDKAVFVLGSGEPGGVSPLARLTDGLGFFPAAFGQTPDPMLASRPKGDLGPKYTVIYRLPGPNNETDRIRQDLYPYARGGPITYLPPGQQFFGTQTTRGGWFRASQAAKSTLEQAGLPRSAPSGGTGGSGFWSLAGGKAALLGMVALLLIAGTALVAVRRRPGAAPAR